MCPNDITNEEFWKLVDTSKFADLLDRIQSVQSGEPMVLDELERLLRNAGALDGNNYRGLAEFLQPLTRRQGFVVDWSSPEVPGWAKSVKIIWSAQSIDNSVIEPGALLAFIPRPKQKRRRTTEQLLHAIIDRGGKWDMVALDLANGKTPEQIAVSYGVPLEVEE